MAKERKHIFNVRVEYDQIPIRHIAVQCPNCEEWFHGRDIADNDLIYRRDIDIAIFNCPLCGTSFGDYDSIAFDYAEIKEVGYPDIYHGVRERKVTWE